MKSTTRILLVMFGALLFAGSLWILQQSLVPGEISKDVPPRLVREDAIVTSDAPIVTSTTIPVNLATPEPFLEDDEPDSPEPRWPDAGTRALVVHVEDRSGRSLAGIPVAALGARPQGPVLSGPRVTRLDGRVRFPIDLRYEREENILVVARAMPGFAASDVVKVALDRDQDVRLAIDPGATAVIRIEDADGLPFKGLARMRKVIVDEPASEPNDRSGRLDDVFAEVTPRAARGDGFWTLPGFRAEEKAVVAVMASGWETVFANVAVPADVGPTFPVLVKLDGRAATVLLEVVPPNPSSPEELTFGAFRPGDTVVSPVGSEDRPMQRDGRFRVTVPVTVANRLRVNVFRNGRLEASKDVDVRPLEGGQEMDLGRITPDLLPVVVEGTVVDVDGRAVSGAAVEVIGSDDGRDVAAVSDAAGRFEIRGIPGRGPYVVGAHLSGRVSAHAWDVADGARGVVLTLEDAGSIAGAFVIPPEATHDRILVRALKDDRTVTVAAVHPDGTFEILGLPGGSYRVIVEGPAIEPIRMTDVTVFPSQTTRDPRFERVVLRAKPRRG